MYIYLKSHSKEICWQKIANQSAFTKLLYLCLCHVACHGNHPIPYPAVKEALAPRQDEEIELGRAFKFLVEADLISLREEVVGHG